MTKSAELSHYLAFALFSYFLFFLFVLLLFASRSCIHPSSFARVILSYSNALLFVLLTFA